MPGTANGPDDGLMWDAVNWAPTAAEKITWVRSFGLMMCGPVGVNWAACMSYRWKSPRIGGPYPVAVSEEG